MKIKLQSDLHHEFYPPGVELRFDPHTNQKDTVMVLAGDISSKPTELISYIRNVSEYFKAVLFVPGNHEYYNNSYENINALLFALDAEIDNVHVLINKTVVIDDVKFIGMTMWTGFKDGNPLIMQTAMQRMNDYRCITYKGTVLQPSDVYDMYVESHEYLLKELDAHDNPDQKVVVINHHSPSWQLVDADYRHEGEINYCYYNDFDAIMEQYKPALWLYGHTHASVDKMIFETRVVSNPFGYYNYAENPNWVHDKLMEI